MDFHDAFEMEDDESSDDSDIGGTLLGNQRSPIRVEMLTLTSSPCTDFPPLQQLESGTLDIRGWQGRDLEIEIEPAAMRSTSKWHRKGAAWPWDLNSPKRDRETESPPIPVLQIDGDDSDSNNSDLFPEANALPVFNLNLFKSFEDDFDDSDI